MKLSDGLVLDARLASEAQERSIAGQVEHWAQLGRAVDLLLRGDVALRLKQTGAARPLSEALASVDTKAGRRRVTDHLASRPYPHFEAADRPGYVVKIGRDGARTVGRFVNRTFRPVKPR